MSHISNNILLSIIMQNCTTTSVRNIHFLLHTSFRSQVDGWMGKCMDNRRRMIDINAMMAFD